MKGSTGRQPESSRTTTWAIAGRLSRPFLPVAALLPILLITLTAGVEQGGIELVPWCIVCGGRGLADGLLNIVLFVPFGWGLGANGRSPARALLIGLSLSLAIESAQFVLPNRFPGLGDVLYNGAGAAIGAALWAAGVGWLRPAGPAPGRRPWGWGALGLFGLVSTPFLLSPAIPDGDYEVHWSPRFEGFGVFRGRMLASRVAGESVAPGLVVPARRLREWLRPGVAAELRFEFGPQQVDLAPLFSLTGHEETLTGPEETQAFLVGADDHDLVVRYRMRSESLRLDRPDLRDPGRPLEWGFGEPVELTVSATRSGVRVSTPGGPARTLDVPVARGWAFLLYEADLERRFGPFLDAAWMALWAIPLGLWGASRGGFGPAAAWIAALVVLPYASAVVGPSWAGVVGIVVGGAAGRLVRAGVEGALRLGPPPGGSRRAAARDSRLRGP